MTKIDYPSSGIVWALTEASAKVTSALKKFEEAFNRVPVGLTRLVRRLQARTAPTTDEESFAMNLARRHAEERDWTLVVEDYAWLGRRLEASGW